VEQSLYGFYSVMGMHHPDLEEWKQVVQEREARYRKHSSSIKVATPKVGRNDPCICGSGKRYKKCCGA
jgi:uncharacterized protein YchJ